MLSLACSFYYARMGKNSIPRRVLPSLSPKEKEEANQHFPSSRKCRSTRIKIDMSSTSPRTQKLPNPPCLQFSSSPPCANTNGRWAKPQAEQELIFTSGENNLYRLRYPVTSFFFSCEKCGLRQGVAGSNFPRSSSGCSPMSACRITYHFDRQRKPSSLYTY